MECFMFGWSNKKEKTTEGTNGPVNKNEVVDGNMGGNGAEKLVNVDAEMTKNMSDLRARLHETFGKVVLAMMTTPRYRNQSLRDLQHLLLDPLMRDRVAIAQSLQKEDASLENTLSGIAIWASVSEEVDAKIMEQIKAGVFPVRLKADEWNSGNINWLLDVVAPSQRLTTAVLTNFKQVVKEGDVRIHPIVARLVDPDVLKSMSVNSD